MKCPTVSVNVAVAIFRDSESEVQRVTVLYLAAGSIREDTKSERPSSTHRPPPYLYKGPTIPRCIHLKGGNSSLCQNVGKKNSVSLINSIPLCLTIIRIDTVLLLFSNATCFVRKRSSVIFYKTLKIKVTFFLFERSVKYYNVYVTIIV